MTASSARGLPSFMHGAACRFARSCSKAPGPPYSLLSWTFEQLIVYSGLVLALFMALTLSTIFHFHRDPANVPHRYQAPPYPFLPATLIMGALALVIYSLLQRPVESLLGAATVLSGIPLYFLWRRSNSSAS